MSEGCRACVFLMIWAGVLTSAIMGYKPVIIIHGISHPGTSVFIPAAYSYVKSMEPMWKQVAGFKDAISPIMESSKDGVHLICFSQGGLICRGLLATIPTHNVDTVIFLSSPIAGQYGGTSYFKRLPTLLTKTKLFEFCYSTTGQKVSVCNYWKDPHQETRYLKSSSFLAPLNGEVQNPNSQEWRDNFLRVQKVVLIGGQDDGVITPWQSSLFGFYDENEMVVDMENQNWYLNDAFGLKTLNMKGAVVKCVLPGIQHTSWHTDPFVYKQCIDKWLT
ncbi:hypothetical protein DNTS_009613 [Danionella cerebrum]|uniref:palmitoyl-CoA hydrolase n=1 Tax=Danionella cerebrum TaxID=2873325 RepID=A0A553R3J2_9TELE|nr:hypothetical protein DNTS_009613 [Danionella translucida]